jgi:hypothetical protein
MPPGNDHLLFSGPAPIVKEFAASLSSVHHFFTLRLNTLPVQLDRLTLDDRICVRREPGPLFLKTNRDGGIFTDLLRAG